MRPDSFLGKGPIHREQIDQRAVGDIGGKTKFPKCLQEAALSHYCGRILRIIERRQEKNTFLFPIKNGKTFRVCGTVRKWRSQEGQTVNTCTIITTEPNDLIRPIHDRMPVILLKEKEALWMDTAAVSQRELSSILKPYPSTEMEAIFPVQTADFFQR